MSEISQDDWERAFGAYALDAATGRLFRGLAHNINGVAQVFSMQTELLQMLFGQAGQLLAQGEKAANLEEAREVCRKLKTMLERRAALVVHLENEVKVIQEIMYRCSKLVTTVAEGEAGGGAFALREVVATELEFMKGDGFFKHKVNKELAIADDLPPLHGHLVEIHQILAVLLENATQALQVASASGLSAPSLWIVGGAGGDSIRLSVSDNGQGVAPGQQERLFEPFSSTRGRLGLGLWLARRLARRLGGDIEFASGEGRTSFTLVIPLRGIGDGG